MKHAIKSWMTMVLEILSKEKEKVEIRTPLSENLRVSYFPMNC
jgi:hypothetical protein